MGAFLQQAGVTEINKYRLYKLYNAIRDAIPMFVCLFVSLVTTPTVISGWTEMMLRFFISQQARIQTVAKVARATVRFFPPRIFRGSPLLDTALRIFRKYILVI